MESFLWALNLCAVVYLCFWGIKADDKERKLKKQQERAQSSSKGSQ